MSTSNENGVNEASGQSNRQADNSRDGQNRASSVPIVSQVMGPDVVRAYTGEKLNGKNWSAFEFGFTAHLVGYNLGEALSEDMADKATQNKVFSTLIAALESSQYVLVNKTKTPVEAWTALKAFYRKRSGQSILILTQKFRHVKLAEDGDLYAHLTMMSNLADELDEVTGSKISNEDFMTTVCFSIMGVKKYANVIEIIMNGSVLQRSEVINKLMATEQRYKTNDELNVEPETAMKVSVKKKNKRKCFNCNKTGHIAKDCRSKAKSSPSGESANKATADTEFLFAAQLGGSDRQEDAKNSWILDSGASAHMVASNGRLIDPKPVDGSINVVLGDGTKLQATHRGQAQISPDVKLTNVLYVPGLQENLFSVASASAMIGVKIVMENGECKVMKLGRVALTARKRGGVFRVVAATACEEHEEGEIVDFHRRCGHTNFKTIVMMSKSGILPPIKGQRTSPDAPCQTCMKGKMTRAPIPKKSMSKSEDAGDLIHSDLCGPMRTRSIQGNVYMVTYLDDFSGWTHLCFLKQKSQQLKAFKGFQMAFERQLGVKIKRLRTDGGGEYSGNQAQEYLSENGIKWERSAPRTQQQNGRAERLNRTIMEMSRCLLIDARLPHGYWQYAATMAAYIRNRTPTSSNEDMATPFELLWDKKPDLCQLPLFGAKAQVHVPDALRGKLDDKAEDCIFLGFAEGAKAFVFERISTKRRFISRDASMHKFPTESEKKMTTPVPIWRPDENREGPKGDVKQGMQSDSVKDTNGEASTEGADRKAESRRDSVDEAAPEQASGKRTRRPPVRFMHEYALTTTTEENAEPRSASEALASVHWRQPMKEEYQALTQNKTWELVSLPAGRAVISGKWCFKAKTDASGAVQRYKARYVARGFTQRPGIDYTETTSPVVSLTSLRAVLATAAHDDMEIKQLDVDSAFLYGHLEEEIYLEQPEGFRQKDDDGEDLVCKLRKAIYGLKQAGRVWWKLIDSELKRVGFINSGEDPCVYTRTRDGHLVFVAIYVDDLIIASRSTAQVFDLERSLREKFSLKPIGDISYVLGLKIERNRSERIL
jgi:hypothetical protein